METAQIGDRALQYSIGNGDYFFTVRTDFNTP
jgi:hypothetical protein